MTTFDKREEGFERKFVHDEELKFKATARRNRLLGLWAAEKLGLAGSDAEAYAKEVVKADFQEAGDADVFRKIRSDFDAKGVAQSDHEIRRTMNELFAKAAGFSILPSQFWAAMPYLMTVVVLTLISMRDRVGLNAPACLGKPFLPAT